MMRGGTQYCFRLAANIVTGPETALFEGRRQQALTYCLRDPRKPIATPCRTHGRERIAKVIASRIESNHLKN